MNVIDRKFQIKAVNPTNGKTYTEADSLLLCAKDAAVPAALAAYGHKCVELGANQEHIDGIALLIGRVEESQRQMGGGRIPDTIGAEIPHCINGEGVEETTTPIIDYGFLLAEIGREGAKAEEAIAAEKLAGNTVKEARAEGEFIAFNVMRSWVRRLQGHKG